MTLTWQKFQAWWQADIGEPGTRSIFDDGTTYRIFPTTKSFALWVWSGPAENSGVLGLMGSDLRSQKRAQRLGRFTSLHAAQDAAAQLEAKNATIQLDRALGVLLATAAGDALGAGYEFSTPPNGFVEMIGGGLGSFEPGEWTDDTAMAVAIAEIASSGADLRDETALDALVERWHHWACGAKDIGVQTQSVLSAAARGGLTALAARQAAQALHEQTGRTAGNGSLMRTAPVALAYLHDEAGLVHAARSISELTHHDPDAAEACVLWCAAIRHAVLTGLLDARIGLRHLPELRQQEWSSRLAEAENATPTDFADTNGWVVAALQAAWSAITTTAIASDDLNAGVLRADHLRLGLEAAVRGGGDTDTVAAIAGALLGAAYGQSAVPATWRVALHGWPGMTTRSLIQLAGTVLRHGQPDPFDGTYQLWNSHPPVQHPRDPGLWLGGVASLRQLPEEVDAVVSLCRVADHDIPSGITHLDVRLIDTPGHNANLDFVLLDTVQAISDLRSQGRIVYLHCVQAASRTPTIAALYGARIAGMNTDEALWEVGAVLPNTEPNPEFRDALHRLEVGS
jgi:ADP-ribosyl-[dinitrogen reductase] hydrolase